MSIDSIMRFVVCERVIMFVQEMNGVCEVCWDARRGQPSLLTSEGTTITGFVDVIDALKEMEIVHVVPRPTTRQMARGV